MIEYVTNQVWMQLVAIQDRAFHRALMRPEFSWDGPNGQRQINIDWLFPWAWSDTSGNPRYSVTAVEIRKAWPDHILFNRDIFLPESRQRRYIEAV